MKKVYTLTLLLLLLAVAGFSQITKVFYAGGGIGGVSTFGGSYRTGSGKFTLPPPGTGVYTRSDDVLIISNNTTARESGYATFDFGAFIPSGATVSSVKFGIRIVGISSATLPSPTNCAIYGRVADYSVLGTWPAATLFPAMNGTGSILVKDNINFGTTVSPGEYSFTDLAGPLCNLVSNAATAGSRLSLSVTMPTISPWTYNFGGELYDSLTAFGSLHCPYLEVTYCFHPEVLVANVAPSPICVGQTFTLTALADGATSYRWRGPNGFNAPGGTVVTTATGLSAGTYSLTAYTACGLFNDSVVYGGSSSMFSTTLAVNPSPATLVTTTTTVCVGNTIYMSDATVGGAWITSNPGQATVTSTGQVTAVASGYPVISYRLGSCLASATVTVNDPPDPITGPNEVCASGGQVTLLNNISGGTWSSANVTRATADPATGVITGVNAGAVNISYFTGGCPSVGYAMTVNPLPNAIVGNAVVCVNANVSLSSSTPGGTWSSGTPSLAVVNPTTGVVTGVGAGSPVDITYTLPTGCYVTHSMTVNAQPNPISGLSALCEGVCTPLSSTTPGGTWSSSSAANATVDLNTGYACAVAAAGTSPYTANITYTSSTNGCYILHAFTVNPLPSAIVGPATVCAASTFNLTNPDPGGAWSSGITSLGTIDASTGNAVAGGPSGVVPFYYTFTATGCNTSLSVTVLPLPISTITPGGPTTFCAGDNVTLTGPTGLGYTYLWYSNGVPMPVEINITYTTSVTEMVTLRVTDGNGCSKLSAPEQITLIPSVAVVAGGPVVFCQPQSVMLSVPLAPGILYQWKLNGVNIPGANAYNYGATVNGVYTADLVVPGGCFSTTPPFTVTVHDMPHPPVSFNGTSINTINGYFDYQWFLNTIAIPGATSTSVTPTVNGQYIVRVIDGNGCVGYSQQYVLNLGIDQVGTGAINIYPNPANTVVNIASPMTLKAVITSIDGRTVLEQQNARQIDISKLSNGLYMIMLYNENGDRMFVQKLTKE